MDAKNDDSAGSDSLDKSLQKKCVVGDMQLGVGASKLISGVAATLVDCNAGSEKKTNKEVVSENSTKKQKTELNGGDDVSGADGSACSGGGCRTAVEQAIKSKAQHSSNFNETESCNEVQKSTTHTATAFATTSGASTTTAAAITIAKSENTPTTNNNTVMSHTFETKVKQISKNLMATTLAESAIKKSEMEDTASASISVSSSSSSETPSESEHPAPSSSLAVSGPTVIDSDPSLAVGSMGSTSESTDEQEQRSRKVRFHPDVKENDGGNRIIPKKKKKLKLTTSTYNDDEASTSTGLRSSCGGTLPRTDDEMELDEEGEEEEEEDEEELAKVEGVFNMESVLAEAKEHLKTHPMSFARPQEKLAGNLPCGLYDVEDLEQMEDSPDEEVDVCQDITPENGVECIVGTHYASGKVEFLLRYADRPGLFWESEEWIQKNCPNQLIKYEQNQERVQLRLMRYVAKRQNARQRYTDF